MFYRELDGCLDSLRRLWKRYSSLFVIGIFLLCPNKAGRYDGYGRDGTGLMSRGVYVAYSLLFGRKLFVNIVLYQSYKHF